MKRILLVDDNPDHRLIVRTLLESYQCLCDEAEDGVIALQMLERTPIDLVLTDMNMPRMDGLQLIESIGAHPRFYAVPIILVTSQIPNVPPSFWEKNHVVAILPKPYDRKKLVSVVLTATENDQSMIPLAG